MHDHIASTRGSDQCRSSLRTCKSLLLNPTRLSLVRAGKEVETLTVVIDAQGWSLGLATMSAYAFLRYVPVGETIADFCPPPESGSLTAVALKPLRDCD